MREGLGVKVAVGHLCNLQNPWMEGCCFRLCCGYGSHPGAESGRSLPALCSAYCCYLDSTAVVLVAAKAEVETPPGHQHCHCRRMEEHCRRFLHQLVKAPCTQIGPKILKRTWQNIAHVALLPRKAWLPGRPGNWFAHRRPSEASQGLCSPRALSQNQLFRRLIDGEKTTAIFFSKYHLCSCKALGRGGLQYMHIVIYQLSMKSALLKVTDTIFLGVECISHFCLSDLSFLWPGFYYPENLF